ncbi:MAG: FtsW/RodA/SpoVE family cell cycle protein [Acidimicrobiia bacterium]|nr:FtsW/RodA/SpoVE family cell cycle protein [Acidimicrobiia bacterium]
MTAIAPVSRRNAELGLMLLAAVLTVGAYLLASLGRTSSLPADAVPFLGVVIGLLVITHVATRRLAPSADGTLLPLAALLNGLGYVFIARLDHRLAGLQALWTALGVAAFVGTLLVVRRTRDLERFRYTFALFGIGLLLMPLLPVVGRNINGARLWVRLGGVSFEPGELAKVALCIFLASYLVERRELLSVGTRRIGRAVVPDLKYFGPILLAWGLAMVVLVAERDVGMSVLFFAFFLAMLWVATARGVYLLIGGAMFTAGSLLAVKAFAHVHDRITVWLNPWPLANGTGFQTIQALFALAAGGIFGTGLALGSPQRIPEVATDFIFAAVGEELGLLGTCAIIIAFLLMVGTGLRIAMRAESPFEKLLATGLATIIGVQAFIIMAGVTRLLPLTGITLPFVSYGGSSLLANYILLALLLRVSDSEATRRSTTANEAVAVVA